MNQTPPWHQQWFDATYQQYLSNPSVKLSNTSPLAHSFTHFDSLELSDQVPSIAQVKLNGGLGTSMGCKGPKSLVQCDTNGDTFLDKIIQNFNSSSISSHLILLNSFNTSSDTSTFINSKYPDLDWLEVLQYPFKKIDLVSNQPFKQHDPFFLNPPGHGSVYFDLYYSGVLKRLKNEGVDYLFISNSDNLAASCDPKIAAHLLKNNIPFLIELTKKNKNDVKGGTIVSSDGVLKLWEIAQVTDQQLPSFQSQPYFNTNNIWVNINALISIIESNQLNLDLILNKKESHGYSFIQLEYAMGSAIQSFENAQVLVVPRQRFFPVKKTTDLLRLLSDLVHIDSSGFLNWDTAQTIDIELKSPFDTVNGFFKHFLVMPSLKKLTQLSLSGPINFSHFIELRNNVKIELKSSDASFTIDSDIDILDDVYFDNDRFNPL